MPKRQGSTAAFVRLRREMVRRIVGRVGPNAGVVWDNLTAVETFSTTTVDTVYRDLKWLKDQAAERRQWTGVERDADIALVNSYVARYRAHEINPESWIPEPGAVGSLMSLLRFKSDVLDYEGFEPDDSLTSADLLAKIDSVIGGEHGRVPVSEDGDAVQRSG